jgi:hypothetical protein
MRGEQEISCNAVGDGRQSTNESQAMDQIDRAIADVRDTLDDDSNAEEPHPAAMSARAEQRDERTQCFGRALERLARAQDDIELRQQDSFWKGYKAKQRAGAH